MSLENTIAENTSAIREMIAAFGSYQSSSPKPAPEKAIQTIVRLVPTIETKSITVEEVRALAVSKKAEGKNAAALVKTFGGVSSCPESELPALYAALEAL